MPFLQAYGQNVTCSGNEVEVNGVCRQCYELGTCDFFAAPLDVMLEPFVAVFGAFFYIIIWGLLIGILWLRVSNTMVVAVVGVVLAILIQTQFTTETQTVGYALLALAITVALYQIFTIRTHFPTN
jgi:hypothetical protein